jgi:hypothetical protein
LQAASKHIKSTFGFDIAVLLANENGQLVTEMEPPGSRIETSVRAGAYRGVPGAQHLSRRADVRFAGLPGGGGHGHDR